MKTNMKKFLSLLLAFSMVLSLMSVSVFAAEIAELSAENVSTVNAGDTVSAIAEGYTLEEANTALAARNLALTENEGEQTTYTVTAVEPEPEGPTEYTITFDAAGGVGEMESVTVQSGTDFVVPACDFSSPEDMYAFAYWKDAEGTVYQAGSTIAVTSDLTLTARWLPDIWTDHITTDDPTDYGVVVDNEAMTVTVYDALGLAWVAKMTNTNNETWNWFEAYTVQLGADINLAGKYWEPIGNASTYDGKFDGQGYTVSNLYQNVYAQDDDYAYLYDGKWSVKNPFGLFGYFYGSSLKNLTVDNFYVFSEGGLIGAVVGYAHPVGDTTFENITVKNCRLNGYNNSCAGVVGYAWCSSSVNCTIYFKNIDVQDSNVFNTNYAAPGTMMAGVLGRFGSNGRLFVDFNNISVSAQLLPLNDAQSAYQYFRFRRAGMLVGDIDDARGSYDPQSYITISGPINIHYGEWSLQRYCEFREAGKPSYSGEGDWRYFRLDEDDNGNHEETYSRLGATVTIADAFSHVHYDDETHDMIIVFDQLIGGYSDGNHVFEPSIWLLDNENVHVTYDVVFHTNGGTINSEYVTSLKPHESAELPTDVTRDGYFFGGWYEHEELTGDPVTSVNSNSQGTVKVFYAKWMRGVEWQNEDGTRLALDLYNDGDTPAYAGATPTKAEDESYTYVFSGWSPAITKVNGGATYTAQFTAVAKNIAEDEEIANDDGSTTTVNSETNTTTVTKTTSSESVAENDDKTTSNTIVTTAVTKNETGAVTNVSSTTETVVKTEETVSESVFTVTTEKTTTTTTQATGEVASTTTNTAEVATTVTLNDTSTESTVSEGVEVTAAASNTIAPEQVNVSAFAKKVLTDYDEDVDTTKNVTVNVQLQLKAELTAYDAEENTITFEAAPYAVTTITVEGGTPVEKEAVKVDNTYLKDAVTVKLPVPSGYAGKAGDTIYVKHSSEGYADDYFAVEVKSEGGKLYVEFEVEHFSTFELMVDGVYAIVFDANGGEGGKTVYIPENGAITAPAVTRSGYIFTGWSPAVPATAAETATYTAQWSAIVYDTGSYTGSNNSPTTTITDEETPLSAFPIFYVDVAQNAWYHDAIAYVTALDLMNGVGDDRFAPNANTTRGMVAVVMMRLAQGEAVDLNSFFDVADDAYYAEAAAWAVENGVYVGYDDGSFRGELNILREQFAAVLYRYATAKGYDVSGKAELGSFTDSASVSGYAADAMAWAVESGIIEGVGDNLLDPLGNATRAQLATMLMRFHALYTAEV